MTYFYYSFINTDGEYDSCVVSYKGSSPFNINETLEDPEVDVIISWQEINKYQYNDLIKNYDIIVPKVKENIIKLVPNEPR